MRGVIIAGTHSGCGKTTITLGIMAALRKKGLQVQPFKTGPDFIDAGLHQLAAGKKSRNLDQWMCGKDYVLACFLKHAAAADVSVIEGVMGMYDGEFSTASLGALLGVPVILVVDAYGMAESAGAMVQGFNEFGVRKPEFGIRINGVIFNRVASENHYSRLKVSVRDVPVLGYLPRELDFEIPHRHLGLATAEEYPLEVENLDRLADAVLRFIDTEQLVNKSDGCRTYPPFQGEGQGGDGSSRISSSDREFTHPRPGPFPEGEGERKVRIAVAYDKAFCFYYEDNLDLLREAGAEIVQFSPLRDKAVPHGVDAVYFGGGYPELHAAELSGNAAMLASVRAWSEAGKPLYAECGGLMYLSQGIRDFDGRSYTMAGLFPFATVMLKKPKLGYREIDLREGCILGAAGDTVRGHEFHYSEIDAMQQAEAGGQSNIYSVADSKGKPSPAAGFRYKNTLASYIHVHFGSNQKIAGRFVELIKGEV